jgi:hypothetical protein
MPQFMCSRCGEFVHYLLFIYILILMEVKTVDKFYAKVYIYILWQ